jgi:hypothetical protein
VLIGSSAQSGMGRTYCSQAFGLWNNGFAANSGAVSFPYDLRNFPDWQRPLALNEPVTLDPSRLPFCGRTSAQPIVPAGALETLLKDEETRRGKLTSLLND